MRKIIFIVFVLLSFVASSQTQVSINHPDAHIQLPFPQMGLSGCVSLCGTSAIAMGWQQVYGKPLTFSTLSGGSTTITGITADSVQIAFFVITQANQRVADTVTLVFDGLKNIPPTVIISNDTTIVAPQSNFILDASKSFDTDGKIVSYQWNGIGVVALSGPFAYIKNPTTNIYSCTITDDAGAKITVSFKLTVSPAPVVPVKTITFYSDGTVK